MTTKTRTITTYIACRSWWDSRAQAWTEPVVLGEIRAATYEAAQRKAEDIWGWGSLHISEKNDERR